MANMLVYQLILPAEATKVLSLFRANEYGHSGIRFDYEAIMKIYYYPNMKLLIPKLINNCVTDRAGKYDRNSLNQCLILQKHPTTKARLFMFGHT